MEKIILINKIPKKNKKMMMVLLILVMKKGKTYTLCFS